MDKRDKVSTFHKELGFIKNGEIRKMVANVLENVPDYFFTAPASSTGKYHPSFSLGEGGLVRHTKIAVQIAVDLFTISPFFTEDEQDCIVGALILHDSCKSGKDNDGGYTKHEHPLLACDLIDEFVEEDNMYKEMIKDCIARHMGIWNTNKYSDVILDKPRSRMERYVHMCDYLSSRKFFDMFSEEK